MWSIKHQSELTVHELYGILRSRNAVYIVELEMPVGDVDGEDIIGDTYHAMYIDENPTKENSTYDSADKNGNVVAYVRMALDKASNHIKFRRVVVAKNHRGQGLATLLMDQAIEWCRSKGIAEIHLAARIHLQKFYESLGFEPIGEQYFIDEVKVWHINMIKKLNSSK